LNKRKITVSCLCSLAAITIIYLFYIEEVKNNLPTPRPSHVPHTTFGEILPKWPGATKPVLLHFYNPDCPCSRFNYKEYRRLQEKYSSYIMFQSISVKQIKQSTLDPHTLWDMDGKLAKLYGVYSTPQAVLVDTNGVLIYRGNYNRSRYCTQNETAFVEKAIQDFICNKPSAQWMIRAGLPYGCSIF
jgi:hypothetical protein